MPARGVGRSSTARLVLWEPRGGASALERLVARATADLAARRGLVAREREQTVVGPNKELKFGATARALPPSCSLWAVSEDVCVWAWGSRLLTYRLKGLPPAPVRFIRSLSVKIDLPSPATSLSKRPGQMWSL